MLGAGEVLNAVKANGPLLVMVGDAVQAHRDVALAVLAASGTPATPTHVRDAVVARHGAHAAGVLRRSAAVEAPRT